MRHVQRVVGLLAVLVTAACAAAAPAPGTPRRSTPASTPQASAGSDVPVARRPPKPKVIISRFRAADGLVVTLARFRGAVSYRLHSGSADPGSGRCPSSVRAEHRRPERRRLLAAFNGGFLLSAGAGGYEQEGHVHPPAASEGWRRLVIDRSGHAQIGSGASALPRPGEPVYSVRQNLRLLVRHGQLTAAPRQLGACGAAPSAAASTWRAARWARTRQASSSTPPACRPPRPPWPRRWSTPARGSPWNSTSTPSGCSWTCARAPGGPLIAADPRAGSARPDQYLVGWTRDFVTVLAAPWPGRPSPGVGRAAQLLGAGKLCWNMARRQRRAQ